MTSAERRIATRTWRRKGAALAAAAAVLASSAAATQPGAAAPAPPLPVKCDKAAGPFHVSGTKVLEAHSKAFVPYGVTATGLAVRNYSVSVADQQIQGAARYWCVNTVRLQVAQGNLLPNGSTESAAFMAALKDAVRTAESYKLVVVISDQTEETGFQPAPTRETEFFWRALSHLYGGDPQVVFDLFNEPRLRTGSIAADWRIWQSGGTYRGASYVGMQELAHYVRHDETAQNLFWVEGPHFATTLNQVSTHRLTVPGVVYDIHHPSGPHDTFSWQNDFGYLLTEHIAPVVDGEWTNYTARKSECWPDARSTVPAYLGYLAKLRVGMTVWALQKGVMIESDNFWDPTHIRSGYSCEKTLDQGAGNLVMRWYKLRNDAS
jgi:hypothetical protein